MCVALRKLWAVKESQGSQGESDGVKMNQVESRGVKGSQGESWGIKGIKGSIYMVQNKVNHPTPPTWGPPKN